MAENIVAFESRIAHPADQVFDWHARPGALERLLPPWSNVKVLARSGGIEDGARVTLSMPLGPLRLRWLAEHRGYVPGSAFSDVQIQGPFSHWEHKHRVIPDGTAACTLADEIHYRLPLGPLGSLLDAALVRGELARTFAYRHRITARDLDAHVPCRSRPLAVAITGASGMVGSTLLSFLRAGGHRTLAIGRAKRSDLGESVAWDPARGQLDAACLEGIDTVVHLAGENIAAGRWTATRKRDILASRVATTRFLAETLATLSTKPRVLVCASAIGFYGARDDGVVTESDAAGKGFLADVCTQWEAATEAASRAGIRVVLLRIGVVLSPRGGALARMLPPFLIGAGGVLGDGHQVMSWVSLEDLTRLIHHVLLDDGFAGPVNAVAPNPVTNRRFTATLGAVLRRPTMIPVPAFALRALFGEMAEELLLAGARVASAKLAGSGFTFVDDTLEGALRSMLGRPLAIG